MHAVGVGVGLLGGGNTRVKADEEADDKVEEGEGGEEAQTEMEMDARRLRSRFACSLTAHKDAHTRTAH